MASQPLVSVVTPTWQRHDTLLTRAISSVYCQNYRNIQHVVVSDGPDPYLADLYEREVFPPNMVYCELPSHDENGPRWGVNARLKGIEVSAAKYIAYLDDDNAFLPWHVQELVSALEANPDAGFAYGRTRWDSDVGIIGTATPGFVGIDTSAIMNRREILDVATWHDDGLQQTIDWDLVSRWMAAKVKWAFVNRVTVEYYNG